MSERWHLNCFDLTEVIVIRNGPDARGIHYIDGRHQVSIGKFETIKQAREACEEHNARLEGRT